MSREREIPETDPHDPGQGGGPATNTANVTPIERLAASWSDLSFYDQNFVMRTLDSAAQAASVTRREAFYVAIAILQTHPGRKRWP